MPFDALVAPARQTSLREILADHGVSPVPLEALAAHKQAQVESFASSFWFRHQTLLPTALLGSVAGMAASGGMAQQIGSGSVWPSVLTLGWMCVIAMLIGAGVFRVRAGSHWEERWVPVGWLDDLEVPEPIAALARTVHGEAPGSALIMGELIQEQVVLDPYLLLERDGELVCLGIWEGGRIVACAD